MIIETISLNEMHWMHGTNWNEKTSSLRRKQYLRYVYNVKATHL